jgi:hypothetical protein
MHELESAACFNPKYEFDSDDKILKNGRIQNNRCIRASSFALHAQILTLDPDKECARSALSVTPINGDAAIQTKCQTVANRFPL